MQILTKVHSCLNFALNGKREKSPNFVEHFLQVIKITSLYNHIFNHPDLFVSIFTDKIDQVKKVICPRSHSQLPALPELDLYFFALSSFHTFPHRITWHETLNEWRNQNPRLGLQTEPLTFLGIQLRGLWDFFHSLQSHEPTTCNLFL